MTTSATTLKANRDKKASDEVRGMAPRGITEFAMT
jgi:hypothetical protein